MKLKINHFFKRLRVEAQLAELRREKEIEQMKKFREMANNR